MPTGYVLSSSVSSGNFTKSGQTVTVTNLSTNGVIPSNASTTFGMIIDMPQGASTVIDNLQES